MTPPPPVVTKPREAKPRSLPAPPTPLTGGDNYGTLPSPLTPAGPRVAVGAGGDNHGTGGAALAMQLRRAYGEAEAALEEWQLEEFTSSVQTYKECGEEAIQPIIQQLNAAARHHDVEMRDRGLKILQALLEADPTPTPTPTLSPTSDGGEHADPNTLLLLLLLLLLRCYCYYDWYCH